MANEPIQPKELREEKTARVGPSVEKARDARRDVYDALLAELTGHTHVWNERRPVAWSAFDAPASDSPVRAGKHVVAIQYGPLPGANGGLLRELVFDFAPGEVPPQHDIQDSDL